MLSANKEAIMTILDTLNLFTLDPFQNNITIAVCLCKLIAKIE